MADQTGSGLCLESVLQAAGAPKQLDRQKGVEAFQQYLVSQELGSCSDKVKAVEEGIQQLLKSDAWECRLGGMSVAQVYVESKLGAKEFDLLMVDECVRLLEDSEVRVRAAVGECLFKLCSKHGVEIYDRCCDAVLTSIYANYDREGEGDKEEEKPADGAPPDLLQSILQEAYKQVPPGQGWMRHGTEGWKCLETSMKAFQHLMEGCGEAIKPKITPALRQLLYRSLLHPNRFVRETSHFAIACLAETFKGRELVEFGAELAPRLADGLSDNWSQVRFAACTATRAFMLCVGDAKEQFYTQLLPPMCLNRYYVAEGVRLYAQESWRLVTGGDGRHLVAQYIDYVVPYYIGQSKANNHAVREAACACIAELMEKIERRAMKPHVETLLRALLFCFKDMSWPVRDAACTACGRCILAYPEESRLVLDELYRLWFAHLWDNIPTVRENSAVALGNCIRAYKDEALQSILPVLREMLPKAKEQVNESEKYSGLENTTTFGVSAQKQRDNDPEVHSGQDMFSCGSLSARFSTSYLVKSDGCMDYGFSRGKQPWEASDGAIYLVRELALSDPSKVDEFLPALADLASIRTFQHAYNMHETIWRVLPKIADGIGKAKFKSFLDLFMEPLLAALSCGHQLAEAAAGRCISYIRDLLGSRMFEARLSPEQKHVIENSQFANQAQVFG